MGPTTKDLAKAAGVSLATVDRVLNRRQGVRKKTVEAVNEAIKKIGFERNQVAATLARRKGYKFAFVLPKSGDEYLSEIKTKIKETAVAGRSEMLEVRTILIDDHDPHKAARSLSRMQPTSYDGAAIMAPETPQIRDAIKRLRDRGIHAVPFVSDQREIEGDRFVGIDNSSAGKTAASLMGRFLGPREGSIAVITDTMQARDSLDRRLGFDEVINNSFTKLKVLPTLETYGDPERTHEIVANVINSRNDLVGFYIMGAEARVPLEALHAAYPENDFVCAAHERTPSTEQGLRSGALDVVIAQDPGHLVRSAVRRLKARCENREFVESQERIRIEILVNENL